MVSIKTVEEFDEKIKGNNVLVVFYAEWSGPCQMLNMVLEEIESECNNYTFVKLDMDRFHGIAKDYSIVNVPVICIFSGGKVVKQQSGLMRKEELLSFLNQ